MQLFRKPRISTESLISFVAATFAILTVSACPIQAQTSELLDKYFFTAENQGLNVGTNARILGQSGSFFEWSGKGNANLLSGTFTIKTGSQALNVRAGAIEVSISPSSTVTIRNDNGLVVSVNDSGSEGTTGITSGGSVLGTLRRGESYPPAEAHLKPIVAQGGLKEPLFSVGKGELRLSGNSDGALALVSGELFFCPSRSLKIETPLGFVSAAPQTSFLVSVSPGTVRVFNCRSGSVKFNSEHKFRKVLQAEEFCIFDHRPTKEEVLPADGIGRKEITLHDVDKERTTASTNVFSVISLLTSPNFLGDWKRSSTFARRLETSLIKSAAAYGGANPGSASFYRTPTAAANEVGGK